MQPNFLKNLPRVFTEIILGAFREEGKRWLESLPEIIRQIEQNWSLEIKNPFPNLSYHYVAPCICKDGGEAVVKIGFPGEAREFLSEMNALKFLGGDGSVKLLNFDERRSAMLLEKIEPGENLKTVCAANKPQAVEIAIDSMRKFWREPPPSGHKFPTLERWFESLRRAEKINFAPEYVGKARKYFDELNSISGKPLLLHGDFHHENILRSATREPFLVIDPKGVVGDAGYDITVFLLNHASWLEKTGETDIEKKLDETISRFSRAFEIVESKIRKWTFAQSVLSACWTFEENCENWKTELAKSEIWKV